MIEWAKFITNEIEKKFGKNQKILLTMDTYNTHFDDTALNILRDHNITCKFIPGGCTSILQPLDVCVNKPFKVEVRSLYLKWQLEEIEKKDKFDAPSRELFINWIL